MLHTERDSNDLLKWELLRVENALKNKNSLSFVRGNYIVRYYFSEYVIIIMTLIDGG